MKEGAWTLVQQENWTKVQAPKYDFKIYFILHRIYLLFYSVVVDLIKFIFVFINLSIILMTLTDYKIRKFKKLI